MLASDRELTIPDREVTTSSLLKKSRASAGQGKNGRDAALAHRINNEPDCQDWCSAFPYWGFAAFGRPAQQRSGDGSAKYASLPLRGPGF